MSIKNRRKFSSSFKSKVALEALTERETIEVLCKKYDLHATQINLWKKELKEKSPQIFEGALSNKSKKESALIEELYKQIGQLKVIKDAISQQGPPRIINSDQGSQFTSDTYINFIKEHHTQISMDGKGRALDNIFIERFWRSLKYENVYLRAYSDGMELFEGLNKYIHFYNNDRPHQSLDYNTPRRAYENGSVSKSIC